MKHVLISIICICLVYNCGEQKEMVKAKGDLEFTINLNEDVYKQTNFGEPPQVAVWFEKEGNKQFQTVWVTYRAGNNDWKGKLESPGALSYWDSRKLLYDDKQVDIVSAATPKNEISILTGKPGDGKWNYFIEVNVSADFNRSFSYWSQNNRPDDESNGQPSLVYKGQIDFDIKQITGVVLVGRTAQFGKVDSLVTNLDGITTALNLITKINVQFTKTFLSNERDSIDLEVN